MNCNTLNNRIEKSSINRENAEDIVGRYRIVKAACEAKKVIRSTNVNKFILLLRELGSKIVEFDFSYENFENSDFSNMEFEKCNLSKAIFSKSNMDETDFILCNLDDATFTGAFMECAFFKECSCRQTDFSQAHLMAVLIHDSDWSEANVCGANLIEYEAHNWKIRGMKVNEHTAINEAEVKGVDWSETDVSKLSISINQVEWFLQCTKGGKYLQVYDKYIPSKVQQREDAILKSLIDLYQSNSNEVLEYEYEDTIFLSYASEQETIVHEFYKLEKRNFPIWMDVELSKDEGLNDQIERILKSCGVAVIFLTKEYLIKAWTRYELWRLSEEKKKRELAIVIVGENEQLTTEILNSLGESDVHVLDNIGQLKDKLKLLLGENDEKIPK